MYCYHSIIIILSSIINQYLIFAQHDDADLCQKMNKLFQNSLSIGIVEDKIFLYQFNHQIYKYSFTIEHNENASKQFEIDFNSEEWYSLFERFSMLKDNKFFNQYVLKRPASNLINHVSMSVQKSSIYYGFHELIFHIIDKNFHLTIEQLYEFSEIKPLNQNETIPDYYSHLIPIWTWNYNEFPVNLNHLYFLIDNKINHAVIYTTLLFQNKIPSGIICLISNDKIIIRKYLSDNDICLTFSSILLKIRFGYYYQGEIHLITYDMVSVFHFNVESLIHSNKNYSLSKTMLTEMFPCIKPKKPPQNPYPKWLKAILAHMVLIICFTIVITILIIAALSYWVLNYFSKNILIKPKTLNKSVKNTLSTPTVISEQKTSFLKNPTSPTSATNSTIVTDNLDKINKTSERSETEQIVSIFLKFDRYKSPKTLNPKLYQKKFTTKQMPNRKSN